METVIVDSGPLVAYLSEADRDHEWVVGVFRGLRRALFTCDAVLSESFFLLRETRSGPEALMELLERGLLISNFNFTVEAAATLRLLKKYRDIPMSFADACVVRMAEIHEDSRVLSLDSDFRLYRKNRRQLIPLLSPTY